MALLGAATGTVIAVRRARVRRDALPHVGPPASWPPLKPGEPPVAAVGDLATVGDAPAAADADDYRAAKGSVIDP